MSSNFRKINGLGLLCVLALAGGVASADSRYDREIVETFDFDVSSGGTLMVDVPDADIVLEVGTSGRVEIEMELSARDLDNARGRYDDMNFRASVSGSKVTLEADRTRGGWGYGSQGHFHVTARIRLPERFDLDLHTNDGDVAVEAIDGRIQIKTEDGDVSIGRASTSGDVKIASSDGDIAIRELVGDVVSVSTSDGDISVGRIDTRELSLRSGDGDISVDAVSGRINANTGDGDISVGIDALGETLLKSGDGDIDIRADASIGADLDLSGDEISFSRTAVLFDGDLTERKAQGRLNGGGPKLTAASRDGSVTLSMR